MQHDTKPLNCIRIPSPRMTMLWPSIPKAEYTPEILNYWCTLYEEAILRWQWKGHFCINSSIYPSIHLFVCLFISFSLTISDNLNMMHSRELYSNIRNYSRLHFIYQSDISLSYVEGICCGKRRRKWFTIFKSYKVL
jgi:hypothetical protein